MVPFPAGGTSLTLLSRFSSLSLSLCMLQMWNRGRNNLLPHLSPVYWAFRLYIMTSTVAVGSSSSYTPVENILINCGSSGNSSALDGRTWTGDLDSRSSSLEQSQNPASLPANADNRSSPVDQVPYATARLSNSGFTYTFQVSPGQKFIRLYFYPASYGSFDRSKALFSVKAGRFTLLSNFNASLTADADAEPQDTIFREYCVNIDEDRRLNITFTPSNSYSYAFINGIEILSMPANLYYTPSVNQQVQVIGSQIPYDISNSTALETVYRVNVGGSFISPIQDTGMFRSWIPDKNYLTQHKMIFVPSDPGINLRFAKVPAYTAPEDVYRTAVTMGNNSAINKSYNLTWEFPVDSRFMYLVRLHFCEFQPMITKLHQRQFLIFIANQTAEEAADVINWAGGNGVPVKRDYVVSMFPQERQKKMNLSIALEANPQDWESDHNNAILNGVEIFKVSNPNDSLAGSNPDPLLPTPRKVEPPGPQKNPKNSTAKIVAGVGGGVSGFFALSVLGFLIYWRRNKVKHPGSSDGTTSWGPFSFSTTKSTKTHKSPLPSALCRSFSLAEIRAATHNFDDVFVIGVGGFGDVYRGYIDGGINPVAIKRLKPGSQQGAHEFQTEIELLSQLRHPHLVSLIGYCNDGDEMILVYDYMSNGTLCDHLYNTSNPPLSWKRRLEICIGAASGLNYLHSGAKHTIIHRDVKTTNILLDEKWEAKVSDFGLSKLGPTSMSKAHVSTVVKGSVGYLDPEYYRRQQLTEKSDVYSFGVVLCEILCAKPPIIRTAKKQVSLAEWVRQSHGSGKTDQIVDPTLKGEIAPECLNKFCEIAVNCLLDNGMERPSMNDVMWGLEFALQLQESVQKDVRLDWVKIETKDDEKALLPKSKGDDSDKMFSSNAGQVPGIHANSSGAQRSGDSSRDSSRLMSSGAVFSEKMNPEGR